MDSEVTLNICDDYSGSRKVIVNSRRFTIGRTSDNDLALKNSNLSRRHAVIENFEGVVQISDCGSQNGTEVNGRPVGAGTILQDGDLIVLGGVCEIEVEINSGEIKASSGEPRQRIANHQLSVQGALQAEAPPSAGNREEPVWAASQVIVISLGLFVIVLAVGFLIFVLTRISDTGPKNRRQVSVNENLVMPPTESPSVPNANTGDLRDDGPASNSDVTLEQLETSASGVVRRLSSDDKPYSFPEKTLEEVGRKINQLRGSPSLPGNLSALQRAAPALVAIARREGIEPGLLIYVVLAESETSRGSDPRSIAQSVLSDLSALRATFGTNDADSSLLLIAAYRMGRGEKRSHPLLATLRKLVKNPLTQRNVWYLNDRGGLTPQSYDFVISVLAVGSISQAPTQFGVSASPLVF